MGARIVFSYRTLRKQETLNSNQGQDILVSDLESQKKKKRGYAIDVLREEEIQQGNAQHQRQTILVTYLKQQETLSIREN